MAVDVAIPAMGESVSEVILIEWLKGDGDYVERDEAICVLETDKANVDLPAPFGPRRPKISPGITSKSTPFNASLSNWPLGPAYVFFKLRMEIAGVSLMR